SDGRKRCSDTPDDLRSIGISLRATITVSRNRSKALLVRPYSLGRIAIETELSFAPLIWSTKGSAESSYFIVFRMPSQSVAPLIGTGLVKWPPCNASIHAPADRLIV